MAELTLKILRADNSTACVSRGMDEARLVFSDEYKEGDRIFLESSEKNIHLVWQVDDAIGASQIYITDYTLIYQVPFGEKRICYSPKAFAGNKHLCSGSYSKALSACSINFIFRYMSSVSGNTIFPILTYFFPLYAESHPDL